MIKFVNLKGGYCKDNSGNIVSTSTNSILDMECKTSIMDFGTSSANVGLTDQIKYTFSKTTHTDPSSSVSFTVPSTRSR